MNCRVVTSRFLIGYSKIAITKVLNVYSPTRVDFDCHTKRKLSLKAFISNFRLNAFSYLVDFYLYLEIFSRQRAFIMEVDKALSKLGGFGKWQIMHFTMLGITGLVAPAFHSLAIVYIGYKPPHRCKIDENANVNESIPYENGQLSSCKMFVNYSMGNETTDCMNGWEYFGDDGPTIVTKWDLVCDKSVLAQTSQTVLVFGTMVGAVLFTTLSDKYGRRPIFLFSQVTMALVGIITAFVDNLYVFFFLRFLTGALQQGVLLPGFILMCELYSTKYRTFVGIMSENFWSLAISIYPLIAYLISNWRYLQIFVSVTGLMLILPLFKCLPESVTWLCANEKYDKATIILKDALKFNKLPVRESVDLTNLKYKNFEKDPLGNDTKQSTNYSFLDFFRHKRLFKHLVICSLLWVVVTLVYYGLTLSTAQLAGNRFWNAFFNAIVEFPANVVLYLVVERCGRKWSLVAWWLITSIPLVISPFIPLKTASGVDLTALQVTLTMIGKFSITCVFNLLVIYLSELFPTNLRVQATGMSSFFGKMGSFMASFASYVMEKYPFLMLLSFGILSFISAILVLFLPETHNKPLPETIEELEHECNKSNKKNSKPKMISDDIL